MGAVLTTPADVVTTRIITAAEVEGQGEGEGEGEGEGGAGAAGDGPLDVALSILQERGL